MISSDLMGPLAYFSVHGNWSSWSPWPNCNKPCNGGNKTRKRKCDNPEPAFGGQKCEGPINETEPCNLYNCPGMHLLRKTEYDFRRWGQVWSCMYGLRKETVRKMFVNAFFYTLFGIIFKASAQKPGMFTYVKWTCSPLSSRISVDRASTLFSGGSIQIFFCPGSGHVDLFTFHILISSWSDKLRSQVQGKNLEQWSGKPSKFTVQGTRGRNSGNGNYTCGLYLSAPN